LVVEPEIIRDKSGQVAIHVPEKSVDVFYTLDGSDPNAESQRFENPFLVKKPSVLKAIAIDKESGRKSEIVVHNLDIPKANWKVLSDDVNAEKAIDEDKNTFWTSAKGEILIDLGAEVSLQGFTYWPPQNRYMSGVISGYLMEGSMDGKVWKALSKGEFANIQNNPIEQTVRFSEQKVRFIRLKALKTTDGNPASFAEVGVLTVD
jgi:alpha-L-fucosidase